MSSGITIIELAGGLLSGSLALSSDAGHIFTDVLALTVSILTLRLARRPHSARRTYGYHRAEIFAALINGSTLIAIALFIIYQAYLRIIQPAPVQSTIVVVVAGIALLANLGTARLLLHHRETSLNVGGIFLHTIGDILSSLAVIIGAVIILFTGYLRADPIIATIIGVLILRSAYYLTRESLDILLEATPKHLSLSEVSHTMLAVEGVRGVHDLHIWTITSGLYALSGHLTVSAHTVKDANLIREKVARKLAERFGIEHVTLQLEGEALETIQRDEGLGL
jgi:cobalt-zinc-cadmium efflux system protein